MAPELHTKRSVLAWRVLAVLAVAWLIAILTEIADQLKLIDSVGENALRAVAFLILSGVFVAVVRRSFRTRVGRIVGFSCLFAIAGEVAIGITEDVDALENVPIIGRSSSVRNVLEKALYGAWLCGAASLLYLVFKSLEDSQDELREANRELREAQDLAVQRERLSAIGEMSHALAHDLNNTLSPIVAYADLLREVAPLNSEHRAWAKAISQAGSDATAVIQGLQRFSAQRSARPMERMDLREVIQQIPYLTRPKWKDEPQQSGHEIDFQLHLPDKPTWIRCDPVELRQVLVNLVFNAVDAMPEGGRLAIRLGRTEESAVLRVSDTGIGMNDEQRSRCFEPFYSAKSYADGLGLSVCFGVVRKHGGNISLSSSDGAGTTIEISLPLVPEDSGAASTAATSSDDRTVRKSILYIDDDARVRESTRRMLESAGHDVRVAGDGPSGFAEFRNGAYDLVITDLGMKVMDGSEVVRVIKEVDPIFPVALISGWPATDVAKRFSGTAKPDWIIEKPATLEDFRPALSPDPE